MKRPIAGEKRVKFEAYGRKVFLQDFILPNGVKDEFFVIESKSSVIIFPITSEGKIIVLRQFRYGINDFVFEFPGGGNKSGQNFKEAAIEELLEETGYFPLKMIRLPDFIFEPAAFRFQFVCFLALGCGKVRKPLLDKTEIIQVKLFSWQKWCRTIFGKNNRVSVDSKTLVMTLLALPYLKGWELEYEGKPIV